MTRAADDAGLARAARILDEVERAVVGKRDVLELVLLGLLADGHVLIEDNPGLAKTLMARSFAAVTGLRFARVQFTPDLMPSDVTGSAIYDQRSGELRFQPGPIFTNVLLGDEINRAPPKTQAALLEAMQERQVTSEDGTPPARAPVPGARDAEPDRVRGHLPAARGAARPLPAADRRRLPRPRRRARAARPAPGARPGRGRARARSSSATSCSPCSGRSRRSTPTPASSRYAVDLVTATRESPQVQVGASPRGSLALLKLARAKAGVAGRDFVTPDDVKRWRSRPWRTGSRCGQSCGSSA